MSDTWLNNMAQRTSATASPRDPSRDSGRETGREPSDAQMDQIRELLFGGIRDEILSRMAALERRVGVLEQSLASMRQEDDLKRRAAFDSLSTAVSDLGQQIRHLARP